MALLRRPKDAPDDFFPGFTDIVEIGTGSLATVFRAREAGTRRLVALKLLNVRDSSPRAIESFERESIALGAVSSHPNIVTLYRSFLAVDGRPVLVLELCAGSIGDRMRTGQGLPVPEVVGLGIKIAGALETAHRAEILHRDVKPQNILITEFGEPALADFGVAMLQSSTQTTAGLFDFTTLHAAPELLEGLATSAATDVYELASTLYQLIAGRSAFRAYDGESPASVILRILRDPVQPLVNAHVPADLSDLLIWAMSKDKDERPPTAAEFAAELASVEVGQNWTRTQFLIRDPAAPGGAAGLSQITRLPGPAMRHEERHSPDPQPLADAEAPADAEPPRPPATSAPPETLAPPETPAPVPQGKDTVFLDTSPWRTPTEPPARRRDVERQDAVSAAQDWSPVVVSAGHRAVDPAFEPPNDQQPDFEPDAEQPEQRHPATGWAIDDDTVPDETVPDETVPDETVPDETVPDETVPDETVPDETVPHVATADINAGVTAAVHTTSLPEPVPDDWSDVSLAGDDAAATGPEDVPPDTRTTEWFNPARQDLPDPSAPPEPQAGPAPPVPDSWAQPAAFWTPLEQPAAPADENSLTDIPILSRLDPVEPVSRQPAIPASDLLPDEPGPPAGSNWFAPIPSAPAHGEAGGSIRGPHHDPGNRGSPSAGTQRPPVFGGDLTLDPMSLRRRVTIRSGAAALTADETRLSLRRWFSRRNLAWSDVMGFEPRFDGGTGRLVAITREGPVELPATKRSAGDLRYLHALLDAYRHRATMSTTP